MSLEKQASGTSARRSRKLKDQPYPRPVIAEALCEIHFDHASSEPASIPWIDSFYEALKTDYPNREDRELIDYRANIGPTGISMSATDSPIQRTVLRHRSGSHLLQLSPGLIAINEVGTYPGWKTFKEHIRRGWDSLVVSSSPNQVTRIGLRYINRIQRRSSDEPVGTWLVDSGYFPRMLLDGTSRFVTRFESSLSAEKRLIVTVAEEGSDAEPRPIIFDLDAIFERRVEVGSSALEPFLEDLHQDIWDAFDKSASETLVREMEGSTKP